MPRVINVKHTNTDRPEDFIYIGRGSKWGNPFYIGRDGSREDVINKYERYAIQQGLKEDAPIELKGKNLGCFCAPLPCHGDILLKWANEV